MQVNNSAYQVGTRVERIAKDYTGGRKGSIVEIMDGRAKVCWTEEKSGSAMQLHTKVRFQDLLILPQRPNWQILELCSIALTTKTQVLALILKDAIDSNNHSADKVMAMIQDNIRDNEAAMCSMLGKFLVNEIKLIPNAAL